MLSLTKLEFLEQKLNFFVRNAFVSLCIIGVIAFIIRLYYFPYDVPLTLDAIVYFFYATDASLLGHLPNGYNFPNNGWPVILSIFFYFFHFNHFLDYMELQRAISLSISVFTIIPVYLLCRRFFDKRYSIVGASIFAFEPRIIQNSLLGITEPLYIIFVTFTIFCFLSNKKTNIYFSFVLAALSSIVRYEGILIFFILSIMFFVRFRKEKLAIPQYILALTLFVLILTPIAYLRIQTIGYDGLTSNVIGGAQTTIEASSQGQDSGLFQILLVGSSNFFKYLGWISLPIFVFFVPLGTILIFRKMNSISVTIILSIIVLSLPAFYAYSREIQETKYLYVLYPLFCILSTLALGRFSAKIKNQNFFLILIIGGVLLSSAIFLDLKKTDYEHQKESFFIAQQVISVATGINDYYPEDTYLSAAQLPKDWPTLKSSIKFPIRVIPTEGFTSLEDYISSSKEQNLTHIVLDGDNNRSAFLNDVFNHEERYPYLNKIFDSSQNDYKYHVKIYKIDYEKFEFTNDN